MKCDEEAYAENVTQCIYHDENYLKDDNYGKNKDEVAEKFQTKLSKYISNNKPLNFQGYCLPEVSLESFEFSQPLDFSKATFYGRVNFHSITFTKEANFIGATFTKEAYFHSATFSEGANFGDDFDGATFSEGANFTNATFTKEAHFNIATFTKEAHFTNATFTKDADFTNATFTKEAYFRSATFSEGANFTNATFTKVAYFRSATFSGTTDFNIATFTKEAYFDSATFSGTAYFGSATFSGTTDFTNATFTKEANFVSTQFLNTLFTQTKFLNEVRFSGSKLFTDEAIFRYTIFEQPSKVLFDVEDLSKVSFAGTDISKVTFTDKVKWGGKDCLKIIEEEWIETGKQKISLGLVLYVYRRLRENYEFNLKFDEAGIFFIKEMELKRKYRTIHLENPGNDGSTESVRKNDPIRRNLSLTGLYYRFSNYGESIVRPTIIGIITVVLSTVFWVMQSKPTLEPHFFINSSLYKSMSHFVFLSQAGNPTQWLAAFQRSLGDFLPVLSLPSDIKVGIIDYIIKIVGGALTFGLLIIAFRRKFERKYTR